jgi:hypothetical protein
MNTLYVKFYENSGHGWLRVKKSLLKSLGIADKITHFSYETGTFAYLEEDVDLATFIKALLAQENIADGTKSYKAWLQNFWANVHRDYKDLQSYIRNLPCYQYKGE